MTTILVSAGNASRLGDAAPHGCKALTVVGGHTMLDWWLAHDEDLILVCRSEHMIGVPDDVRVVICDDLAGPATAVAAALPACEAPVTVAYADTWVPDVPDGTDWCGVAEAEGGRMWDVLDGRHLAYQHVERGETVEVAVGLYRFSDLHKLKHALEASIAVAEFEDTQAGMADAVNFYGCKMLSVPGWQDVGDLRALAAWTAP